MKPEELACLAEGAAAGDLTGEEQQRLADEVMRLAWERGLFTQVADLADDLFDALFAQQDLWSDKRYREIQVAAVKVDVALSDLASESDYVRQENRSG